MCNIKGVTHRDKPTKTWRGTLLVPSIDFSKKKKNVLLKTPINPAHCSEPN